ncbi:MAG: c-type cytochrome [Gammaproteobacteria bacterium]|nr:c-type cytochrome [Gammaproteobacteria bacterium]
MKTLISIALLMLSPIMVNASPNGQQLFENNCSVCHGTKGGGGVGIPLALPSFINSVSDNYLRKTIRYGRPGRVMPSFNNLSDDEILSIVNYMRTWTGKKGKTFSKHNITGNPQAGGKLFNKLCISCHGVGGIGGAGTGVTFSRPRNSPIIAPSLNNPGFLSSAEDEFIKETLVNGRAGTPMISYKQFGLSDQDINNLVSYIRGFEAGPYPFKSYDTESAVIKVDSPYSIEETINNVKDAIIGKNFKLIRVQELNQGLVEAGKENKKSYIIYFCNFNFLNKALAIDPRVGMFLPCRVTVIEQNGKVSIISTNPLKLASLFNNHELSEACKEMHTIYSELLEEASL